MSAFKNQQIHSCHGRVHISTIIHHFGVTELVVHGTVTLWSVATHSNMSPQSSHVKSAVQWVIYDTTMNGILSHSSEHLQVMGKAEESSLYKS